MGLEANFDGAKKKMQALFRMEGATKKALTGAMGLTVKRAQQNVTNSILNVRTGHLKRNIGGLVKETGGGLFEVWIGTGNYIGRDQVIYASVHETGMVITPKKGKWLRFPIMAKRGGTSMKGAHWVTVARVTIPPRHWLSRSIAESDGYFRSALAPKSLLREMGFADFEAGGD